MISHFSKPTYFLKMDLLYIRNSIKLSFLFNEALSIKRSCRSISAISSAFCCCGSEEIIALYTSIVSGWNASWRIINRFERLLPLESFSFMHLSDLPEFRLNSAEVKSEFSLICKVSLCSWPFLWWRKELVMLIL